MYYVVQIINFPAFKAGRPCFYFILLLSTPEANYGVVFESIYYPPEISIYCVPIE